MRVAKAALLNLVHLARSDGEMTADEIETIRGYGQALGLRPREIARILALRRTGVVCPSQFTQSHYERIHVIRMLARVAHADGVLSCAERGILQRVAESLEIGPLEFADILVTLDHHSDTRQGLNTARLAGLIAAPCVLLLIWAVHYHLLGENHRIAAEAERGRGRLEQLAIEGDAAAQREAKAAIAQVNATRTRFETTEADLRAAMRRLEDRAAVEASAPTPGEQEIRGGFREELARLKDELRRVQDVRSVFQRVEREASPSVVLLFWRVEFKRRAVTNTLSGWGTGFFVRADGLIVTNKHIVRPWLFTAEARKLLDRGFEVDEDSLLLAAWPTGRFVRNTPRTLRLSTAFHTADKTLEVVCTTPDVFVQTSRRLASGSRLDGDYHALDRNDLAVLRADFGGRPGVAPLRLAPADHQAQKLEPVMVLGFPGNITARETLQAETAPSLGEVRKVETSIFVDAPIVPGNSGGPLMDAQGQVIGVAFATFGASTVGGCIPIRYVHELLASVPD